MPTIGPKHGLPVTLRSRARDARPQAHAAA
jgi:hypothetical protein